MSFKQRRNIRTQAQLPKAQATKAVSGPISDEVYNRDIAPFRVDLSDLSTALAHPLPEWADQRKNASAGRRAALMIKSMRLAAGLTQAQLAEKTGINQAEISATENSTGAQGPSYERLAKIADACGFFLGFTPKDASRRARSQAVKSTAQSQSTRSPGTEDPLVLKEETDALVLTVSDRMCRWPIGDPAAQEFHFCGRSPKADSPYCEEHARKAYQPAYRHSPTNKRRMENSVVKAFYVYSLDGKTMSTELDHVVESMFTHSGLKVRMLTLKNAEAAAARTIAEAAGSGEIYEHGEEIEAEEVAEHWRAK